ncbi:MAG: pyruvate kinase [Thermoanaerobaculales bacterium]|nr:pyruvate kinase [Thermoanaerobaculales bacterium]
MGHRKTKIVCTLGPATDSPAGIAGLIAAGMDVVRLNFSHGDREQHRATIRRIREVARAAGRDIAILQDLGGPKIRLGTLPDAGVVLETGGTVELAPEGRAPAGTLPVSYPYLVEDSRPGETILLADGAAELEILEVRADRLVCRVVNGGLLTSRKGVNLPQADLRVAAVTDKDLADLEVGLAEGVDLVALSFVRHEDDLGPIRSRLAGIPRPPLVIAKIEKPQAVDRLASIIAAVDGVMVARGDLGVEMPPEKVPLIQKRIIEAARRAGRPVITATQMLRSMVDSPRPLRAEASDIANAVLDGTDALMLSEETAIGRYPVEAVSMLDRVAGEAESHLDHLRLADLPAAVGRPDVSAAISRAACELADAIGAAAIVTTTTSGGTARLIARHRPPVPVLGIASSDAVARQLRLSWGVIPIAAAETADVASLVGLVRRELAARDLAEPGDHVVIAAGLPLGFSDSASLLQIRRLE